MEEAPLREALAAIIEGKSVRRIRHELSYNGKDVSGMFLEELEAQGYRRCRVRDIDVKPGERVPAFYVLDGTAWFGWIFWEQFTSWKMRKLWGSEIRNKLGDWEIQIPETRDTIIYANSAIVLEMDIDNPPAL